MNDKQRTLQQNAAMHKYFELLADGMNAAGYDVEATLKNYTLDVPWTPELVKTLLWKWAIGRMYSKDSTTKLNTKEIDVVYDVVNRFVTEKLGLESIPFPSTEELINAQRAREN